MNVIASSCLTVTVVHMEQNDNVFADSSCVASSLSSGSRSTLQAASCLQ